MSNPITFNNFLLGPTSQVTFTLAAGTPSALSMTLNQGQSVACGVDGFPPPPWTLATNVSDTSAPLYPGYDLATTVLNSLPTTVTILPYYGVLDVDGSVTPPPSSATAAVSGKNVVASIFDNPAAQYSIAPPELSLLDADLAFTMQQQAQSQWCWCTVASCVGNYYSGSSQWTQCALATWKFPHCGNCCNTPLPTGCNSPSSVMDALHYVGHLQAGTMGSLTFDAVKAQIDQKHPIGVNVQWNGTTFLHSIAITGYSDGTAGKQITLQDPSDASTTVMLYADFPARYKTGASWYATFTTKS